MTDPLRVPMKPKGASFIRPDDIAASLMAAPNLRHARRFSIDVAEEAFANLGGVMVEWVGKELAQQIVWREKATIRREVDRLIMDRTFMEPILKECIRAGVKDWIATMMQHTALSRNDFFASVRQMVREDTR